MKLKGTFRGLDYKIVSSPEEPKDERDIYFAGVICPHCSSANCKLTAKDDRFIERNYECEDCGCEFEAIPKGLKLKKDLSELDEEELDEVIGTRFAIGAIIWLIIIITTGIMYYINCKTMEETQALFHTPSGIIFFLCFCVFLLFASIVLIANIVLDD